MGSDRLYRAKQLDGVGVRDQKLYIAYRPIRRRVYLSTVDVLDGCFSEEEVHTSIVIK